MLTKKQAEFNDVTLEQSLAEGLPAYNMDKDQLEQAVINLILNAIEATDPGGKITVTTRFVPEDDKVELTVSDSGRGISAKDMARIFDPFFTTTESGTGLGLAITHGIIEQHGGTINVETELGQGTTFTVGLPLNHGDRDDH